MLKLTAPSIGGHKSFRIGSRRFGVPEGSRIEYRQGGGVVYVMTPQNTVHAYVARGEIALPPELRELVRQQVFSGATSP